MFGFDPEYRRFSVHGLPVEVACEVGLLNEQIRRLLGPFEVPQWPEGFVPTSGTIRPYIEAEVMAYLSPTARPVQRPGELIELYEKDERFWLIDDRWGICEINLLKGQWRSWIIPQPMVDPIRCAEMAILWPLAQLLRARELYLLPAASIAGDGWGALILSSCGIDAELQMLIRRGYRVIGQRWTAVREEDGRISLLHMPGQVEREMGPRPAKSSVHLEPRWIDLTEQAPPQHHAFCHSVLIVEPARRPRADLSPIPQAGAIDALRRAWPIVELHPHRRHGRLPGKIAQRCRCWQLQLSRQAEGMRMLVDSLRPLTLAAVA